MAGNLNDVMLSKAKHLAFQAFATSRFFDYRLRMTLQHSLWAGAKIEIMGAEWKE